MKNVPKNTRLRFDVFGIQMVIERNKEQWLLFNVSKHGLLTRNKDVAIPAELTDAQLCTYLDDLFHEKATIENAEVKPLN